MTGFEKHFRIESSEIKTWRFGDDMSPHLKDKHSQRPTNLHEQFTILKKCCGKFECPIYEMLLIRKKRPTLNTQNDSIPAELFIEIFLILLFISPLIYFNVFSQSLLTI